MTKLSIVTCSLLIIINFNANAAECSSFLERHVPTSRFVIHHNGTFTDKVTGLMWSRCFAGMIWKNNNCEGEWLELNWKDTIIQANTSEYAGFTDWRLPNTQETLTLVEYSCYPTINDDLLKFIPPTTHTKIWTSTFYDNNVTWQLDAYNVSLSHNGSLSLAVVDLNYFSLHVRGGNKI